MKKAISLWTAMLLATASLILYGCSVEIDAESEQTYNKLIGTWELIHMNETETMRYNGEGPEVPIMNEDYDVDQRSTDYCVLEFGRSGIKIKATGDPEIYQYIDIPFPYQIEDGIYLHSVLMAGDYTDMWTITKLTNNKLVLYQEDEGYTDSGDYDSDHCTMTFRKVNENIIFIDLEYRELIRKLANNWMTTHITETKKITDKSGKVEVLKDIDQDLTATDEDFQLLSFSYFFVRLMATGNPEMLENVGKIYSFRIVNGNEIMCPIFEGKYVNVSTIDVTDDQLVITLKDVGTNQDKELYENYKTVTYKKVSLDQLTKE